MSTRMLIQLAAITADQKAQPRTAIHVDKVAEYTEDMKRGDKFPPLIVFQEGERFRLADGFHRFYAAPGANITAMACDVRPGGLREAVLYSCGANAAHGLRRTNQDKQRAVAKLLEDEEWAKWSDGEIARRASVSDEFVRKMRKEVASDTSNVGSMERTFIHPKTGAPTTMNTANIGRKPIEQQPSEIAETLEDIRRCIKFMPAPTDAVDAFPAEKFYFFPVSELDELAAWMADFAAAWRAKMEQKARAAG